MTTNTKLPARRRARGMYPKGRSVQQKARGKGSTLPEYLTHTEVNAMLKHAPHADARLLMLIQWRSGLRVSEALALRWYDVQVEIPGAVEHPTIMVRRGKGNKMRSVPLHPELRAALVTAFDYRRGAKSGDLIVPFSRHTAARWVQLTAEKARQNDDLPEGRHVTTHTFRHSYARHLLASKIPVNALSRWMGHSHISYTLVYLELLPDPTGSMETVP